MKRNLLALALLAAVGGCAAFRIGGPKILSEWTRGPAMIRARAEATGVYAAGRYYVIGGFTQDAEYYDPKTKDWTEIASPPVRRGFAQAAAVGRTIYVFGGCIDGDCSNATSANWAYDVDANEWSSRAPMPTARFGAFVGVIDGKIYAAGGYVPVFEPTSVLEVYDPRRNVWTKKSSMPAKFGSGGAGAVGGKLYVLGGTVNSAGQPVAATARAMAYAPRSDSWTDVSPLPEARGLTSSGVLRDSIYVFGGYDADGVLSLKTWKFDPRLNSWSSGPELNDARHYAAAAGGGGRLFVSGATKGNAASTSFETALLVPDERRP